MVKGCSRPLRCRMAQRTILWETRVHMVWIRCRREITQVARNASRTQCLSRRMTGDARQRRMGTGQWEGCLRVIKGGRLPPRGGVALRAVLRKTNGCVIGVRRSVEIRQVTRDTSLWRSREHATNVTRSATDGDMGPR